MSSQITALLYILFIGFFTFAYLKLAIEPVVFKKELRVWAASWFGVTALAFLSHNFLLFSFLSAVLIYFASKLVQNKFALFCVLLLAIPTYEAKISVLFSTTYTRELALIILLPLYRLLDSKRLLNTRPELPKFGKLTVDKLIIAFLILKSLLIFRGLSEPIEPLTSSEVIRQIFYVFCEFFLPYYIASRYIKDFNQLKTAMIAFMAAAMLAGSIAIFELGRSWLLFGDLHRMLGIEGWGQSMYIGRSNLIRASASLEHPLALGFVMLIATGFFLFISHLIKDIKLQFVGFMLLVGGLIAPLSRGPWMGAFFMLLVYLAIGHKKGRNFTLFISAVIISVPTLYFTPGGSKIIDLLPFIGKVDKFNVDYRSNLIDQSLLVIQNRPLLGVFNPTREPEMQVLIQGQGIIDLVNYYLELTLTNGVIGLLLFISTCLILLTSVFSHIGKMPNKTALEYLCGKSLFAAFLGAMLTISTTSGLSIINTVLFVMLGLMVSYIRVTQDVEFESIEKTEYPTSRIIKHNE